MGKKELCANFISRVSHMIFAIATFVLLAIGCIVVIKYTPYVKSFQFTDVEKMNLKWNEANPEKEQYISKKWKLLDPIGYFMVGFGVNGLVLLALVYILGCKQKCEVYSFAGIVGFIAAIEAFMVITLYMYSGECKAVVGDIMRENIERFKNPNISDLTFREHLNYTKNMWDDLQENFKCCGVDKYTDWEDISFDWGVYIPTYEDDQRAIEWISMEKFAPLSCCTNATCNHTEHVTCVTQFENWLEYILKFVGQIITTIAAVQLISMCMIFYFDKERAKLSLSDFICSMKNEDLDYKKISETPESEIPKIE